MATLSNMPASSEKQTGENTNSVTTSSQFGNASSIPARALDRASEQDKIAISDELEQEILRILMERFRWPRRRVKAALDVALKRSLRFTPVERIHICRDPKDDMFLECAAEAGADVLVTGDRDLLALGAYLDTRIVTPSEYIDLP